MEFKNLIISLSSETGNGKAKISNFLKMNERIFIFCVLKVKHMQVSEMSLFHFTEICIAITRNFIKFIAILSCRFFCSFFPSFKCQMNVNQRRKWQKRRNFEKKLKKVIQITQMRVSKNVVKLAPYQMWPCVCSSARVLRI